MSERELAALEAWLNLVSDEDVISDDDEMDDES